MTKIKEILPKEYLQKFMEESRKMRSVEAINEDIKKPRRDCETRKEKEHSAS